MIRVDFSTDETRYRTSVPVVAVGASAGGLEELQKLFRLLSTDTGAAFVVLLHLAPDRASQLDQILGHATVLPVVAIEHGMKLEANRVHVIPPGQRLSLAGDTFQLYPDERHSAITGLIDAFFRNLAEQKGHAAAGIILSGSGNDGALGLKAIKAAGGLTLAQTPDSAQHDSMPRSAIETAVPDYILDTAGLVQPLENHLRLNFRDHDSAPSGEGVVDDDALAQTLTLLCERERNHNFVSYKPIMLKRRIERRMGMKGLSRFSDYLAQLQDDPAECARLGQDFLISVTDFFRDPETYETLESYALEPLLADHKPREPLRIWVPGCATGEEAYSIAISAIEAIAASGKNCQLTVFASDIDQSALDFARAGVYPDSIADVISEARLAMFFNKLDRHYQVKSSLREHVVFAIQNVTTDPPYSSLDLVSCRNLLMYFQPAMQRRVLASFHFALKTDGFLFLGNSETIGDQIDLFETVAKERRLFRRIGPEQRSRLDLPFVPQPRRSSSPLAQAITTPSARRDNVEIIARDLLLQEHVPAAVLINRKLEILCSYGPTRDYLALPFGQSSLALIEMVHDEYRSTVRAATHRAFRNDARVEVATSCHGSSDKSLTITARPLRHPESARGLMLVIFERTVSGGVDGARAPTSSPNPLEQQLADELDATRRELHSTIQALEASNEDMKSSNEEILSMNEELQSSNEELETSKEELQSLNEELVTVNGELETKVAELETAHNDLHNLFSGTHLATLFLDRALCIKRFTPTVKELLSVIDSDIGRPLSDITFKFADPDLLTDADAVLQDLAARENETLADDGRWYLRRVLPYRTRSDAIEGLVITFTNISETKRIAITTHLSEQRLDIAVGALGGGIWEMAINPGAPAESTDRIHISSRLKHLLGFDDGQLPDSLASWRERVLEADRHLFHQLGEPESGALPSIEYRARRRDGELRWFASQSCVVEDEQGRPTRWIGVDYDITEIKQAELGSRRMRTQLHVFANALPMMVIYVDTGQHIQFSNTAFNEFFANDIEAIAGRRVAEILDPDFHKQMRPSIELALAGRAVTCRLTHTSSSQDRHTLEIKHVPHSVDGEVVGYYALMQDVTDPDRRKDDRQARASGLVYMQRMATLGELASTIAHDLRQPLAAINNFAAALTRMLHAGKPADETTPVLHKIANQVRHADDIIENTRRFVGRRDAGSEEIDLNTLVERALSLTESSARHLGIDRRLELQNSLPLTRCYPVQIEQIIINLFINAHQAMEAVDRGARTLTVTTQATEAGYVRLVVNDTGEGVAADKMGGIFDTFYTTKLDGMGMGLALSRTIAEEHEGRLWAESQQGEGATFFLELPGRRRRRG